MDNSKIQLMVWNILEGWHDKDAFGKMVWNEDRFQACHQLIQEHSPDILVLNEALWACPVEGYFIDYAKLLGFPFVCAEVYDGHWGNCILSRFPIISKTPFSIYNRSGLSVILDTPVSPTSIATYHPHPSRYPQNKAKDYAALVEGKEGVGSIVCGDFNAISPEDEIHLEKMVAAFAHFSKDPLSAFARFTEGGQAVFPALTDLGFTDAIPLSKRDYTIPTDLISKNKDSAMRIDHIWANSNILVEDGGVLHHSLADLGSDHYPTYLIFSTNS